MSRFGKGPIQKKNTDVSAAASKATDFEGSSDALLLNAKVGKTRLFFPSKDKDLVVRPFFALDPTDPEHKFLRARAGAGERQQSDWLVLMPTCNYIGSGKNRVTFILHEVNEDEDKIRNNPYRVLYWNAYRAKERGQWADGKDWDGRLNKLFARTEGSPSLTAPDFMGFMQGAVLINGDNNYLVSKGKRKEPVPYGLGEDDALPIIRLGKVTTINLLNLLDERKEGADEEENINKMFKHDVIGFKGKEGNLVGGRILEVFKTGPKIKPGEVSTWDGKPPEKKGMWSWHVNLLKEYAGSDGETFAAGLSAEHVQRIHAIANFWLDYKVGKTNMPGILRVMSYEEQALVIAKAFADCGGLLTRCWEENPEYLTDDVKGVLKGRVLSVVPGNDDEEVVEGEEGEEEVEAKPKTKVKVKDKVANSKKSPAAAKYEQEEEEEEVVETEEETEEEEVTEEEEEVTEEEEEVTEEEGEEEEEVTEEEEEVTEEEEEVTEEEEEVTEEEVEEEEEGTTEEEVEEEEEVTEEEDDFSDPAVTDDDIEEARAAAGKAKPATTKPAGRVPPKTAAPKPPVGKVGTKPVTKPATKPAAVATKTVAKPATAKPGVKTVTKPVAGKTATVKPGTSTGAKTVVKKAGTTTAGRR